MRMGKKVKSVLFELLSNLEARVQEFVMQYLGWFCVETLRDELIKNMIPNLMKEVEKVDERDTVAYELLEDYVIQPPTYSSVLRWLHTTGFTYSIK